MQLPWVYTLFEIIIIILLQTLSYVETYLICWILKANHIAVLAAALKFSISLLRVR